MRVFDASTEGYIKGEYRGLVINFIVCVRLVADQVVREKWKICGVQAATHSCLSYQLAGLLDHWQWMNVWEDEMLDLLCAKEKEIWESMSHSVIVT